MTPPNLPSESAPGAAFNANSGATSGAASGAGAPLLSPEFMRRLEAWSLVIRRSATGVYGGERRTRRIGHSVEFADFRNYTPGDDVRFVDWNLYARLEKLYLKLFLHERETNAHILIDLSESMTFGSPSKALLARKLAAALGYLALFHQDGLSISVGCARVEGPATVFPLSRGRGFNLRMIDFLSRAPEGGELKFGPFVERRLSHISRPGLVILISDFMDPTGFEAAIRAAVARRHEVIVIHALDPAEIDPRYEGDLKLIDAETGGGVEISATGWALEAYRRRAQAWLEGISAFCNRRGATYLRALTTESPEGAVLKSLRRMGRVG